MLCAMLPLQVLYIAGHVRLHSLSATRMCYSVLTTIYFSPQSQLSVANQSLTESRGEVDKLVTQLKNQKECEDAAMSTAKKKHASEMRAMQQKV